MHESEEFSYDITKSKYEDIFRKKFENESNATNGILKQTAALT